MLKTFLSEIQAAGTLHMRVSENEQIFFFFCSFSVAAILIAREEAKNT